MLLFWTEPEYLLAMAGWLAVMVLTLRWLLQTRRRLRVLAPRKTRRSLYVAFSTWLVLALLTAFELSFAAFVDHSDAFNMTNISKRWFRRHIETQRNLAGFRDQREFVEQLPDGLRRIVFLGDSFTIGHGIRRREDRFTDRVEAAIEQVAPGQYQVANLGECGWEVSMIEAMMKATFEKGYRTNVVVYVYMLNDIEGYDPRTQATIRELQETQPQSGLWTNTYFFNWLYFRWQQYQAGRTVDYFPHLANSYRSEAWRKVRNSLRRMHANAREHGTEFRLVVFPFLHNLGPDYPFQAVHQQLVDFCREEGIAVLDLEPVLTPHRSEGLVVNAFDNHPNEFCHGLVAEAILKELLSDLVPQRD